MSSRYSLEKGGARNHLWFDSTQHLPLFGAMPGPFADLLLVSAG